MAIQVKHSKVSTIPDTDDTSLVRPSDWNADHVLTGTIPVANGGTGADNPTDARTNLSAAKSGANSDITSMTGVTGGISSPDYIQFDTTYATTLTTGQLGWDGNNTLGLGMSGGNVIQQIGLQTFIYGKASSAITKGQLIKKTGATGSSGVITFAPTTANMTNSTDIIGIAAEDIALNGFGYIMSTGNLRGFNTTGASSGETWADGDTLYYNPAGNGLMTKTKPSAPNSKTEVAVVTNAGSGGSGSVVVEIIHGTQLGGTDSNVQLTSVNNGNILSYDGGNGYWKNTDLTAGTGISISKSANGVLTVTNSSPNTYDPSNVAITGGTINGTTIGATTASTGSFTTLNSTGGALNGTIGTTTPAAGTFTTITGQTEVLRGTGQNLLTRSQDLLNAAWVSTATTVSATLYTDPLGGTTANNLIETATTNNHIIGINATVVAGLTYTFSVYLKKGIGATAPDWVQLSLSFAQFGTTYANFNLNTGVVGTTSGTVSSSITFVGNGWYRCSYTAICTTAGSSLFVVAFTNNSNGAGRLPSYAGATTSDMLVWGAQTELGSVVNTYIPTTTTAVYGTPTLSFSGVSTIGLQSDGSLYVSPAGTGAIQAQATTSTATGGNARGANAVDWQTSRTAASQVASGAQSVVGGGQNNSAQAFASVVAGGSAGSFAASANYGAILGGSQNTVSAPYGIAIGGYLNTAGGRYNLIGGGYQNSATASAAVTTQTAATTINSTAVTLSASNASIKVGQLVTGTGITSFPDTYVAAISGTNLTLSQNAASSQASTTLSFFTPHGVVVGGGNNQATGAYSFIGGGGDAGTAGNRNVASGDWSTVGGGQQNTASGIGAVVAGGGTFGSGGSGNTASGVGSAILGGWGNTASGTGASVISGNNNTSNASRTTVLGSLATARAINGIFAMQPCNSPISANGGINQTSILVLARQTTDATATVLASDSAAAGTTNQVILPNNSAYYFTGEIVSGVTGGGNSKGWEISGLIKRGANAAATTLVGSTVTSLYADAGAATWTIALAADTTNGGLRVTFTGQAGTTIRTVCQIRTTEMTY